MVENVKEKNQKNWLKSAANLTLDIAMPGSVSLLTPIEGVPRELRYNIRLWRVRGGHALHSVVAAAAIMAGEYPIAAISLVTGLPGCIGVCRFSWRRAKRMYFPFLP